MRRRRGFIFWHPTTVGLAEIRQWRGREHAAAAAANCACMEVSRIASQRRHSQHRAASKSTDHINDFKLSGEPSKRNVRDSAI